MLGQVAVALEQVPIKEAVKAFDGLKSDCKWEMLEFLEDLELECGEAEVSVSGGVRPLSVQSGWVPYGGGYEAPSMTKHGDLCVVSGLIKRSSMSKVLTTLPPDCRPNMRIIFNLIGQEHPLRVDVATNGVVE